MVLVAMAGVFLQRTLHVFLFAAHHWAQRPTHSKLPVPNPQSKSRSPTHTLSQLALSWVLISLTMFFGLATESWSRPAERDADGYRGWVGDPPRSERLMALTLKKRAFRGRNYVHRPDGQIRYDYEQTVSSLSSSERYELENQYVPPRPEPLTYDERGELRKYASKYTSSWVKRMAPHVVGWFPYVACWVVYFNFFLDNLNDLKIQDEELFDRVPDFVPWAVGATALWFTSFTFVQVSTVFSTTLTTVPRTPTPCSHTLFFAVALSVHFTRSLLEDRALVLCPEPWREVNARRSSLRQRAHVRVLRRGPERHSGE